MTILPDCRGVVGGTRGVFASSESSPAAADATFGGTVGVDGTESMDPIFFGIVGDCGRDGYCGVMIRVGVRVPCSPSFHKRK